MSQREIEIILIRQLASCLMMPMFIVDTQGTLLFYNEPAEAILGKRFDETGEMPPLEWASIWAPTDESGRSIPAEELPLWIALTEQRPTHLEFRIRGLDQVSSSIGALAFPLDRTGRAPSGSGRHLLGAERMMVRLWGTRGSLAAPGVETARYGGNTSCVEVRGRDGGVLVLDAGTGVRRLGAALPTDLRRVDILLTHLHMDHVQGLGFFDPLYRPDLDIHMWGPASPMAESARAPDALSVAAALPRPPARPALLAHPAPGPLHALRDRRVHGLGRRSSAIRARRSAIASSRVPACVTYLPDHEPALGVANFPRAGEWTSGYALAAGADLLLHDSQYTAEEYRSRVGWGHSAIEHTVAFAELAKARHLVTFHHDPSHDDWALDQLTGYAAGLTKSSMQISPGTEGATFEVGNGAAAAVAAAER